MWDQPLLPKVTVHTVRIIPTYVGSTHLRRLMLLRITNHSHVCGINHHIQPGTLMTFRIIPTYVGSTTRSNSSPLSVANHSHVCGINAAGADGLRAGRRIIPTYVGSTRVSSDSPSLPANHSHVCGINRSSAGRSWPQPNHSHVCGINLWPVTQSRTRTESFPRMWDQQYPIRSVLCRFRIIPTYVGSTA